MLCLASRSPRRRQLLEQLGVDFHVLKVDVPEQRESGETPLGYVERVARDKGRAALAHLGDAPGVKVLAADTEVVLGDDVFGKPETAAEATMMLQRLSGRVHQTMSVVWLLEHDRETCLHCVSHVTFAELDAVGIKAYVATGESYGKAGGYAIQGRAAAFVAHLEGSYSGVMGLPLHETARLLELF